MMVHTSAISKASELLLLLLASILPQAVAHTVLTYPGWRGNSLVSNGTLPELNPDSRGIDHYDNGSFGYPWGMEWMYPCGGMPQTTNRTKWPVNGGAVAFQPGWFPGHSVAFIYVNMGIQEPGFLAPPNMSHNVVPPFQIVGPSNLQYPGTVCLPQVPMPANLNFEIGDNITLQVVESAQHGAALYSCVDVTLADPHDPELVTVDTTNCFNSSDISFNLLFTTSSLSGATTVTVPSMLVVAAFMALTVTVFMGELL